MSYRIRTLLLLFAALATSVCGQEPTASFTLDWSALPPIPNELGLAGPIVGVHNDALIVAGGANFPNKPLWETSKVWHDEIYVLTAENADGGEWMSAGKLSRPLGYAACVSTDDGVLVMGGNDSEQTYDEVFMLRWVDGAIQRVDYPPLLEERAFGTAASIGDAVYFANGQGGAELSTASTTLWKMQLKSTPSECKWEALPPCPGPPRTVSLAVAQHNGFDQCLYVMSGRRLKADETEFLKDVWEYNPTKNSWRQRANAPTRLMAGPGIAFGKNHIFVLGGDDGELFLKADDIKDDHPGFPKAAYSYHTITDRWFKVGETPANHVTTTAVNFQGKIVVPSGEVRPRVRSPNVWSIEVTPAKSGFGTVNYVVLFGYLAAMVGVGLYFAKGNKSTDDYFRGGKRIPWWAAGCSIYATMLSSLTFTGIPSKAFQQDWVVAVLNFTIPVVAFAAVGVALPFFRRIDATSAYEYLERRFSRPIRMFGSASFTLYHLFRMAVVLALTGLALDVATPLTPVQSVLIMGVLSILYCTMGGIEAVIWTDTIQTVVLLGGAVVAVFYLLGGIDGGVSGLLTAASAENKFKWAHFNTDITSAQVAIWFIVIGGLAQNVSSYTADQAVVQRYMTTETEKLAAKSIWTNAFLSIPTTLLFFAIGTALFAFYRSQPERLDPTITSDQIFPLFIAQELPVGIAGLIVAGIFAAAQSTVSTSMNSMATSTVTDFLRPINIFSTETGYLRAAQVLTLLFGLAGTGIGLYFINPSIMSLFDEFVKIVGIFMGVLGGLFILGAMTKRANSVGALVGALAGAMTMFYVWKFTNITGYLYTFFGITSCVIVGYAASLVIPAAQKDLAGLTVYTIENDADEADKGE